MSSEIPALLSEPHFCPELLFMARQPILDAAKHLYGYELLFRSGPDVAFADMGSEGAMGSILDLSLIFGTGSFTDGHRAFINCTREHLCSGVVRTLPRHLAVLEILEDVPADKETVGECRRLKAEGYTIAVDDIVSTSERTELVDLADIVKVDFLLTSAVQQQEIARRFARPGVRLLAEKVETHEQFQSARKMGYTLFQGYFFCRPETLSAKALPSAQIGYLEILRRVFQPQVDIRELAQAIQTEPSLVYRLLRFINSAARGCRQVKSITQALNLLGTDEIRKWVSMVAAINLAGPRSKELIRMALIRAYFCEQVAGHLQLPASDFYLAGLFSLLDALLDLSLPQIVEQVPLPESCREALTGASNRQGIALKLAMAIEIGDWEAVAQYCSGLKCDEEEAWKWHQKAQRSASMMEIGNR